MADKRKPTSTARSYAPILAAVEPGYIGRRPDDDVRRCNGLTRYDADHRQDNPHASSGLGLALALILSN